MSESECVAPGVLYVVATPIGNLADLSRRAEAVLAGVSTIAAEDTRHTGQMLARLGISTRVVSLHEHNEDARTPALIERLRRDQAVALVSDAGTPLVSDPGYRLLAAARAAGISVSPVPGPCAAIAALSIAGLPSDRFVFEGFLPARGAARRSRLEALSREIRTLIFYESGRRLAACLADMAQVLGQARNATLARELTKRFESIRHGTLSELDACVAGEQDWCRGELTVIVRGADPQPATTGLELTRLMESLLSELPVSRAVAVAARATGRRRNELYKLAVDMHGRS